eukprot:s542_g6.t1
MILLQCKYPEIDSSVQEWKEIEQFMNFTKQTGIKWANQQGATKSVPSLPLGGYREFTSPASQLSLRWTV